MDEIAKYAKLIGVDPNADFSEIKQKYEIRRQKYDAQLRSGNIKKAMQGQKNLTRLDQAYQALSAHALARRDERMAEAADTASFEIGTHRVGFNVSNLDGFESADRSKFRQYKISWPGAKIFFYNDRLKLKALVFTTEIPYRYIKNIKRYFYLPFVFQVRHRAPEVMPNVIVYGVGLGRKFKRLNQEHHLNLPISY